MQDDQQVHAQPTSVTTRAPAGQMFRGLDTTGRFRRDGGIGRLFHPGTVSYRELVPENSLHVIVDGDEVSAHIDRFSPLAFTGGGPTDYSLWRAAVHNVWGAAKDVLRLLGGHRGDGRCDPACEWVDVDDDMIDELLNGGDEVAGSVEAALQRILRELSSGTVDGVRRVPFSVIDEVVDLLDTDDEPWSVQLEMRVAGRLDDDRLRAAVREALRRHPLARARKMAPAHSQRNYWEIPPDVDVEPFAVRECPDDVALQAARGQLQSTRVPLSHSPPLRVWLAHHPGGDVVMMNLHHAAADAFGGLRLLRSVARAYTGDADPLPDVDFLADRDLAGTFAGADPSTRLRRYLAVLERLRDLLHSPARLVRCEGDATPGYGFHHERLDAEQTQRLVRLEHPGSVNDVLVAAMHLAIEEWNSRQGSPSRRISVLVPADLRPPEWHGEFVANFSLPARVSTVPAQRTTPRTTLAAVTAQTSRKKRSGMGTALLEVLNRSWLLPLRAKERLARTRIVTDRFADTAVLSNLGSFKEPPAFGTDAGETEELWFSAPTRMPLGLSVGAATVAGRLHLAFRYPHPQFGPRAARRFAACYLSSLRRLLEAPSG